MTYAERVTDLFTVDETYCLVHCISADFSVSKGIVAEFNRRFDLGRHLRTLHPGYAIRWKESGMKFDCLRVGRVFNLVTKARYAYKPTYGAMQGALELLRIQCVEGGVKRIAMPTIGCGLDRLKWEKVSAMIRETFAETDVEILVCLHEAADA